MNETINCLLNEERIPKFWYNLVADLPAPPPPVLHPGTLKPLGPDDLAPLFPMSLIQQEFEGVSRAILFNLCGHGHFDMQAYIDFHAGKLVDQDYDPSELAMALAGLPSVPGR